MRNANRYRKALTWRQNAWRDESGPEAAQRGLTGASALRLAPRRLSERSGDRRSQAESSHELVRSGRLGEVCKRRKLSSLQVSETVGNLAGRRLSERNSQMVRQRKLQELSEDESSGAHGLSERPGNRNSHIERTAAGLSKVSNWPKSQEAKASKLAGLANCGISDTAREKTIM